MHNSPPPPPPVTGAKMGASLKEDEDGTNELKDTVLGDEERYS